MNAKDFNTLFSEKYVEIVIRKENHDRFSPVLVNKGLSKNYLEQVIVYEGGDFSSLEDVMGNISYIMKSPRLIFKEEKYNSAAYPLRNFDIVEVCGTLFLYLGHDKGFEDNNLVYHNFKPFDKQWLLKVCEVYNEARKYVASIVIENKKQAESIVANALDKIKVIQSYDINDREVLVKYCPGEQINITGEFKIVYPFSLEAFYDFLKGIGASDFMVKKWGLIK